MRPNDPLYHLQLHFAGLGTFNGERLIERVWDEYSGSGVSVAVFDNGIQYTHPDLAANMRMVLGEGHVAMHAYRNEAGQRTAALHGTAVAGLIGAANNGIGVVGIAFNSTLESVRYIDNQTIDKIRSLRWSLDISNHSWGDIRTEFLRENGSYGQRNLMVTEFELAAQNRQGLGTIQLKSSGNSNYDANHDWLNANRYVISIGSIRDDGFASGFSNYGSCLLVTAPGGTNFTEPGRNLVTTDLVGAEGNNLFSNMSGASDYTDYFNGTSASTPLVSGVVALMLQANPGLHWQEVQQILALSARHTGSNFGVDKSATENFSWLFNHAKSWNGGGAHYSNDYGYGAVDVFNAVRMAEYWTLFRGPPSVVPLPAPGMTIAQGGVRNESSLAIPDNGTPLVLEYNVSQNIDVQHVSVSEGFAHSRTTDLRMYLESPSGTRIQVFSGAGELPTVSESGSKFWKFGVNGFRGEKSQGTWKFIIVDAVPGVSGGTSPNYRDPQIIISGSATSINNTYHYTQEYWKFVGLNPLRANLTDTDGGFDWLNAASMLRNLQIDLRAGMTSTSDELNFIRIAAGTTIEGVVTGDGNDTVQGNGANNHIYGGRGNDRLFGEAGDDVLKGERGNDILDPGATGIDRLEGGLGNDTYVLGTRSIGAGEVTIVDTSGTDTISISSSVSLASLPSIENVVLIGSAASALNGTGDARNNILTGHAGRNTLSGADGHDTLNPGDAGIDRLDGGLGNDTYVLGNRVVGTADVLIADAGGIDTVSSTISRSISAMPGVENLVLISSTGVNLMGTGNANNNVMIGGNGNETFNPGLSGIDSLQGRLGDDTYVLNNRVISSTQVFIVDTGGVDTVTSTISRSISALTSIEKLTFLGSAATILNGVGNAGHNTITGHAGRNALVGNNGHDVLLGGLGNDALTGGDHNDIFVFNTALNATTNKDVITDFVVVNDSIRLENAIFTKLIQSTSTTGVALLAKYFTANDQGMAKHADHRIIYETDTGLLRYDVDGNKLGGVAGVVFADLASLLPLTNADFLVI